MTDKEFWESTLYSLQLRVEARRRNLHIQQRLLAWHAANIMNTQIKGTIRPEQLMGEGPADNTMDGMDQVWLQSLERWLEGKGSSPW